MRCAEPILCIRDASRQSLWQTPRGPMKPLDPSARASRPEFDVHLTENVILLMRDGVRMATDVYRPARVGRERRRVAADNTVVHEQGRESRVVLPIVAIERS